MITYKFSETCPDAIEYIVENDNGKSITKSFFNIDVQEVENGYKYIPVYIDNSILDSLIKMDKEHKYNKTIEWIIADQYKVPATTAILSNYLSDPDNEKYINEFNELQSWRKLVKTYVKYIVENEII